MRVLKLLFGFCTYLLISIFYQKFFGEEPFNNAFSIGLPRFYFEFYTNDGIKLNGSNFLNLIINIIIYLAIVIIYFKFIKAKKVSNNDGKQ